MVPTHIAISDSPQMVAAPAAGVHPSCPRHQRPLYIVIPSVDLEPTPTLPDLQTDVPVARSSVMSRISNPVPAIAPRCDGTPGRLTLWSRGLSPTLNLADPPGLLAGPASSCVGRLHRDSRSS